MTRMSKAICRVPLKSGRAEGTHVLCCAEAWGQGGIETFLMDLFRRCQGKGLSFSLYSCWEWSDAFGNELAALGIDRYTVLRDQKPGQVKRLQEGSGARHLHCSACGVVLMSIALKDELVSIVMPLCNNERFVSETVESVFSQTYENWELLVVDDCSTDGSVDIVKAYCERGNGDGVRLFKLDVNGGAAKARQAALSHARGSWVAYLDSDDVWAPDKLQRQLEFMGAERASMRFTGYETIGEDGSHRNIVHVPKSMCYKDFPMQTIACSHTIMFDLSRAPLGLLSEVRDVPYDYPEDLDIRLRVLKTGVVVRGIDEPLAKYRRHEGSRSFAKSNAVARTWNQYTRNEGLNTAYSAYCLFWHLTHAVLKRI